ncbi:Hsp20/alpha crystallin family protein [Microbacterium sp. TNHR37B]|uniref:Hsp20/alpha crystallin family protein n=1 Tax=Microbacterium sp. TNHR37B TaxID=1775956 RepID=UPI0007B2F8D5|nr:Hsp20/alpha crystallin family protein [Microbacterium sp. TNHR37B]KZE89432.1 Alpha-crystallin [Microbacterium sp. TNHR37B]
MARNLARFDPFWGLDVLRRDLLGTTLLSTSRGKTPTTDVYTKGDDALVVEAHLPSFDEKDVSVTVDSGALVIQAERREKEEDKGKNYVVRESSTSYYRSIGLPEQADESEISADFTKGVLTVTVPLRGGASPRSIAIGSETRPAVAGASETADSIAAGASPEGEQSRQG